MIKTPEEFLGIVKGGGSKSSFRLGEIGSPYSSGRPTVIFDGETGASTKQYPYLSSYTPAANDRVLLVKVAGSYVILGKII